MFMGFIVLIGHIYGTVYGYGSDSVLFAFLFALFSSFIGYFFSDKIALAVNGAKQISENDDPELFHVVESLALTAGIPMPRIYIVNDPAPNAFATGRNPKHAAMAVTTGLRQIMTKSELEGVLAHELSHISNYDVLFMTLVSVFVGTITMLADWFFRFSFLGGRRDDRDGRNINPIFMILGIVLIILSPIIATIIQLSISRKREFLADASGALLTRYPEGLASALEKIKAASQPLRNANKATAHMYIANPLKADSINKLFATHPPIEERIKVLRQMNI
ncbi:MAG: zinc metalloprotease HtpX [Candidatus Abawacabacteria bacterium]|nr:zinc metalloprotease HtpX [Candidatus Abawacabacteria bacterium]